MSADLDGVVLKPGASITFEDRDDLLAQLDRLDQRLPKRSQGRTRDHREHFCIVRYLRFLAGSAQLSLPVTLRKPVADPPDFVLEWPTGRETFELTDGSTKEYQARLARTDRDPTDLGLPVDVDTPDREAEQLWAEILFAAFRKKARGLVDGRYDVDHLLIYDLTGLGLFLPLARGAPLLRERVEAWIRSEDPRYRFRRVSVLRDGGLLLDVAGEARILRAESPYFRLAEVWARDEEDLKRRLREIDRYCRSHSIRRLRAFGSVLGDRLEGPASAGDESGFRVEGDASDVDLLVEFEPGATVTLLDMARMERELSELIGFKVDLRTAGDLSRYFREEVEAEAVAYV